jgi:hypothetical protein
VLGVPMPHPPDLRRRMGSAADCMDGMCRRMSTAVTAGYHRLKDDDASKDKPRDRPGARAEGTSNTDGSKAVECQNSSPVWCVVIHVAK